MAPGQAAGGELPRALSLPAALLPRAGPRAGLRAFPPGGACNSAFPLLRADFWDLLVGKGCTEHLVQPAAPYRDLEPRSSLPVLGGSPGAICQPQGVGGLTPPPSRCPASS